jgi:hypothetical protein
LKSSALMEAAVVSEKKPKLLAAEIVRFPS